MIIILLSGSKDEVSRLNPTLRSPSIPSTFSVPLLSTIGSGDIRRSSHRHKYSQVVLEATEIFIER